MTTDAKPKRAPSFFVSHGAGPFAILGADHQQPLVDLCKETAWVLDGCKGVILCSAHWQTEQPHISCEPKPHIYYDYFDEFTDQLPKEAWEIKYNATGDPEMAHRIKEVLDKDFGYNCVLDDTRGWDHGTWVPMILLRPQEDLPCIQMSIPLGDSDKETKESLRLGQALAQFRDEGWVILGSGSSYHNFRVIIPSFFPPYSRDGIPDNRAFEDAMEKVAKHPNGKEKCEMMTRWREDFPQADLIQPTGSDEHFMPFCVNIGAAGDAVGEKLGEWNLFGTWMSSYIWN